MRWLSHHAPLKRTSTVFCRSLALLHELRSRSGLRKKDSRTTRCNSYVGRTPAQNLCVFTHVPPSCSLLLAQNFDVFHDEITSLFMHSSSGRGPIGVW